MEGREYSKEKQEKEVDKNYEVFKKLLPEIIGEHENEWALMSNEKIIGYFAEYGDAKKAGMRLYAENGNLYSIQSY